MNLRRNCNVMQLHCAVAVWQDSRKTNLKTFFYWPSDVWQIFTLASKVKKICTLGEDKTNEKNDQRRVGLSKLRHVTITLKYTLVFSWGLFLWSTVQARKLKSWLFHKLKLSPIVPILPTLIMKWPHFLSVLLNSEDLNENEIGCIFPFHRVKINARIFWWSG